MHARTHRENLLAQSTSRKIKDIRWKQRRNDFYEGEIDADVSLSDREKDALLLGKRGQIILRTTKNLSDAQASLK